MLRIGFSKNHAVLTSAMKLPVRFVHPQETDPKNYIVHGEQIKESSSKRSFGRALYDRLRDPSRADKILQICSLTGATMTTGTFLSQSVAVAEGLREKNVRRGDFILVVGNNSLNMNVAMVGIFLLGAVAVPVSYFANPDELRILLTSIQPKLFICDGQTLFTIRRIVTTVLGPLDPDRVILLNDSKYLDSPMQIFPEFIQGKENKWETFKPSEVKNPKEDLALVMKSLSEGAGSRGVGITHSNLLSVINRLEVTRASEISKEVILMVTKIIWMAGIFPLMCSCYFGSKLVVMSELEEEEFMKAIETHKVTTCYIHQPRVWQLYKHDNQRKYDLSSCNKFFVIGQGSPDLLIQLMKEKYGLVIKPAYSIAEMTGIVMEPTKDTKEGSVGKLVPLCSAKVVSVKTNQKYGPNKVGEICFKGPNLMKGYVNDEKANREVIDKEGFLHSGEYGYYDEDGEFFIVDKLKQVIKYKNHELSPIEIEGIIRSNEAVKDCVVSGIPHPKDGFHAAAFVVLQPGFTATAENIKKLIEERLPEYKHLRGGVVFIPKVPRSRESGFIKRSAINKVLSRYRLVTEVTNGTEDVMELPRQETLEPSKNEPKPEKLEEETFAEPTPPTKDIDKRS